MYLICQCNVIILCKVFSIVIAVRTKFREFGLGTMSIFNNLKTRAVYTTVYIILIKSSFDENSINNITYNEEMKHTGILSNR